MAQVLIEQFTARTGKAPGARAAGSAAANGGGGFPAAGTNGMRQRPKDVGLLWVLESNGTPKPIRVKTGISDGQLTEIRSSEIKEGMEVIKTITLSAKEQAAQGPPRMRIL
jgi:hypothetical protein